MRTINHPGIEIKEIDLSQTPPAMAGTYALLPGFCHKGVDLTPIEISTMTEYETMLGAPTNEAERYHYYATKDVLDNHGHAIVGKLPYDNTFAKEYKYCGLNVNSETDYDNSKLLEVITKSVEGEVFIESLAKYNKDLTDDAKLHLGEDDYPVIKLALGSDYTDALASRIELETEFVASTGVDDVDASFVRYRGIELLPVATMTNSAFSAIEAGGK